MDNKKYKEIAVYLQKQYKNITHGPWGRFGFWNDAKAPSPNKSSTEIVPGLTVGAVGHMEPIARFSGYKHNVEENADFVCNVINHIPDLLNYISELEEENEILIQRILRAKDDKNILS